MTVKWHVNIRNAVLDAWETAIGTSPTLEIFTGTPPANLGDADSGTKLLSIPLDSDWAAAASGGSKSVSGLPETATGITDGSAGYYRLKNSSSVVYEQGTVTATGGGGDMTINNVVIATGQDVDLTSWSKTAPSA